MRAARIVTAVASALVLLVTGYGWTAYRELGARLVTSDVLTRDRPSDGVTDILLVGLDSRTDAAGNPLPRELLDALAAGPDQGTLNTDTLILVRVPDDATLPTTAVSIPRDSFVPVPGFGTHKINSAYVRGADAARARLVAQGVTGAALEQQAAQAGRRTLITTVEQLTGASVDHYAEVNLAGFAEITQAVGGVPVCLNAPVRDSYSGADFRAGPQTLEGPAALAFVRQRHGLPRGDLDRVVRQQAFLASFAHEVRSAGTLADPAQLSDLITTVGRYVVIDPGWDLLAFAARRAGSRPARSASARSRPAGRTCPPRTTGWPCRSTRRRCATSSPRCPRARPPGHRPPTRSNGRTAADGPGPRRRPRSPRPECAASTEDRPASSPIDRDRACARRLIDAVR